MISFNDRASLAGALSRPLEQRLRTLLAARLARLVTPDGDLTDLTHIVVIESGDTEADIRRALGFSPLENPLDGTRYGSPAFQPFWDWLQRHNGWFELIVTIGNSGFADVLFIQDTDGVEPALLALCRTHAA